MSWSSLTTLAGVGVAVVGLATVVATTSSDSAGTTDLPPATTVSVAPATTARPDVPVISRPEIPGVSGEVTRVLYWAGAAETATPLELPGVPEEVGSILVEYGIPLRVATASDGVEE